MAARRPISIVMAGSMLNSSPLSASTPDRALDTSLSSSATDSPDTPSPSVSVEPSPPHHANAAAATTAATLAPSASPTISPAGSASPGMARMSIQATGSPLGLATPPATTTTISTPPVGRVSVIQTGSLLASSPFTSQSSLQSRPISVTATGSALSGSSGAATPAPITGFTITKTASPAAAAAIPTSIASKPATKTSAAASQQQHIESLDQLPEDVIHLILAFSAPQERAYLSILCKSLYELCKRHEDWWHAFIVDEFGQPLCDSLERNGKTKLRSFNWRIRYFSLAWQFDKAWCPIHWCADHNPTTKVLQLLRAGVPVDTEDERAHRAAIHIASARGHIEMVNLLLDHNANIEAKTHCRFTPMHFACKFGRRDMIELLTARKGLLTAWDQWEKTPLEYAVTLNRVEAVSYMLDLGQDVNIRFMGERTILHIAAFQGLMEMAELVLKRGGKPNLIDKDGRTGLHYASQRGNTDMVDLLLKYKADPTVQDNKSYIALDYARCKANLATTRALIKWYKDRGQEAPKPPPNVNSLLPKANPPSRLVALTLDAGVGAGAANIIKQARNQVAAAK